MSVRVSEYERALGKRTGRKEKERERVVGFGRTGG